MFSAPRVTERGFPAVTVDPRGGRRGRRGTSRGESSLEVGGCRSEGGSPSPKARSDGLVPFWYLTGCAVLLTSVLHRLVFVLFQ